MNDHKLLSHTITLRPSSNFAMKLNWDKIIQLPNTGLLVGQNLSNRSTLCNKTEMLSICRESAWHHSVTSAYIHKLKPYVTLDLLSYDLSFSFVYSYRC